MVLYVVFRPDSYATCLVFKCATTLAKKRFYRPVKVFEQSFAVSCLQVVVVIRLRVYTEATQLTHRHSMYGICESAQICKDRLEEKKQGNIRTNRT